MASDNDHGGNVGGVDTRPPGEIEQQSAVLAPEAALRDPETVPHRNDEVEYDSEFGEVGTFSFDNLPPLEEMVHPADTSVNANHHHDATPERNNTPTVRFSFEDAQPNSTTTFGGLTAQSDGVNMAQTSASAPASSPTSHTAFPLSLHDATIKCVCPPGTTRLAKDIVFLGANKGGPVWAHLPCKPFTTNMPAEKAEQIKALINAAGTPDISEHVTKMLGHAPNEQQQLFIKHFTSTFHCDGPCENPKPRSEFFLCKKCCAWQHKPCMLYGDRQDRGGPVCNRCYMSFLLHRDEIVDWQRQRLLLAVKEGYIYLNNPENRHQEWRRAWIRRWLARFFEHNQGVLHAYNVARKKAERAAAIQAYYSRYSRVRVMPQTGQTQPTQAQSASKKKTSARKQSKQKKAPAQEDEDDDVQMEDVQQVDEGDSDEIVVASSAKSKGKSAKSKAKPTPARSTTKKAGSKRQPSSSLSPSPLAKKSKKPEPKSRAPRKSAPTFGRFDFSDGDDEDDDDAEQPLAQRNIVPQADRRGNTAPSKSTVSCRCPGKAPTARDCFKCRDCGMLQHYACATDIKDGLSVVCNFCHVRSPGPSPEPPPARRLPLQAPATVKQAPKPKPKAKAVSFQPPPPPPQQTVKPPQQTVQPSQQKVQPPQKYDPALKDEVDHLCSTVLWREYCSIPFPDEEEPPDPNSGPAPPTWLAECQNRLMTLLASAGQEKTSKYLAPALAAWPRQNGQIMKALRELAIEEIFYGTFMRKRKDLGVLLEVLGLEEKGSVWKVR
ncbi:hypothetical protein PRZ48_009218 [Zasmidium cellare]|uniref:Zinc finger PHD-type domain-containing protein n=1 Tax=Zasmidium cellare TaxID=395010 RepID=A0ABR0EBX0_ZASCE|nr:hypothetical protein PRZ48_009218 [Zasmidium cellare]